MQSNQKYEASRGKTMTKCFRCEEEKSGCKKFLEDLVKGGVCVCPECVNEIIEDYFSDGGWLDGLEWIEG